MMEAIRQWIIGIVVTIIFMSIIDLVLPDNSFRKYAKLATGLIVIITILSPVFKLLKSGMNIEQYIDSYAETLSIGSAVDTSQVEAMVDNETIKVFKDNLTDEIEESVLSSLGKNCSVTNIEIVEDTSSKSFGKVINLEMKVKTGKVQSIEPVDKIVIGQKQENTTDTNSEAERDGEILKLLEDRFGVDASTVKFIK